MQYYIAIKIHISEIYSIAHKKANNKDRKKILHSNKFLYIFRNANRGHLLVIFL